MIIIQIFHAFACITLLLFISLLYLYFRNKREKSFLYASLFFLSVTFVLFGMYHLELNLKSTNIIFWSKFLYVGVFGFLYTLPCFTTSITGEKLSNYVKQGLGILTLICVGFVIFTNLIITNRTVIQSGLKLADKAMLYPYAVTMVTSISLYFYVHIITLSKKRLSKPIKYTPIIVGMGIGIATGIIDFIGISSGKPLIPGIRNPFIFGIFITSLSFGWTFLSQYSWAFSNLDKLHEEVNRLIAKSNRDFVEFVQLVAKTLDAKDHYTAGHSLRVMDHAIKIAQTLNLPEPEIELLKQACLLHDIGKIGIPDGILNKKTPLTKEERKHIFRHPVVGIQILSAVSEFKQTLDIIYAHHERVDGNGYPDGKTKEEIPLLARILAVADAYDAMRSERPYRSAKTLKEAIKELKKVKGSQLDEEIVEKFIELLSAA